MLFFCLFVDVLCLFVANLHFLLFWGCFWSHYTHFALLCGYFAPLCRYYYYLCRFFFFFYINFGGHTTHPCCVFKRVVEVQCGISRVAAVLNHRRVLQQTTQTNKGVIQFDLVCLNIDPQWLLIMCSLLVKATSVQRLWSGKAAQVTWPVTCLLFQRHTGFLQSNTQWPAAPSQANNNPPETGCGRPSALESLCILTYR